ncbi:MAG: DUF1801 domain-containing protein [Phycisphaerales bacterium]
MQSKAKTVAEYIASLPDDRRHAIETIRKVIKDNLSENIEEGMTYGMIGYYIPHSVFPAGYHCDPKQPVPYAGLASQKNHMSLYLMSVYCGCTPEMETNDAKWFREAWTKAGKKLDMGACCVRFKKLEDVPLDVVAQAIKRVPAKKFLDLYQKSLELNAKNKAKRSAAKKSTFKKAPVKKTGATRTAKKAVTRK